MKKTTYLLFALVGATLAGACILPLCAFKERPDTYPGKRTGHFALAAAPDTLTYRFAVPDSLTICYHAVGFDSENTAIAVTCADTDSITVVMNAGFKGNADVHMTAEGSLWIDIDMQTLRDSAGTDWIEVDLQQPLLQVARVTVPATSPFSLRGECRWQMSR